MFFKDYRKYSNWYSLTSKKLQSKYKDDFKLICGLISATSPQFSVKRNMNVTKEIYKDFKEDKQTFIEFFESKKAYAKMNYKIMNCHYNNILRVLKHDFTSEKPLILGGLKVNSFYNNLIGNLDYVTIDTWMGRFFNHKQAWINKGDYIRYSKIISRLARKEDLKPAQFQAVVWIKIREDCGFKPVNFTKFV